MRCAKVGLPLLSLMLVAGCGGGSSDAPTPAPSSTATPSPTPTPTPMPTPTPTPVASVERAVSPTLVDGRVTTFTADNIVINPASAASPKGKLLVMLPGTGGTPAGYELILREGVARGYHAIGLMYPDQPAIEVLCANGDADCSGNARREIVTGADTSTLVTINPGNSIVDRLTMLLGYLARTAPNEGWGNYLVNGQPDWSRITIAGHSQGAGHAAFMAKLYSFNRVAMFSGPADRPNDTWLGMANVTPPARMYGLIHSSDSLVPPVRAETNWQTLMLAGPVVQLDGTSGYAGPSHQLTTAVTPRPNTGSDNPTHLAPISDRATPLTASGAPQLAPVWDYMAFP